MTGSVPCVVLFDLGGVVCHFLPARRLAQMAAAAHLTVEAVAERLAEGNFIRQADLGHYSAPEMRAIVRARLNLLLPDAAIDRLWATAFEPDAPMLALVDQVARYTRTALLSDNPPLLHEALPEVLPAVAQRFDPCLFSYQFGACKPDAVLFAGALERLGATGSEVLFIDDNPVAVAGARAAGLIALLFSSVETTRAGLTRWFPSLQGAPP